MEITEVRIFPRESKDKKLKAYATITFDDSFVVRDMKVIQGTKGYFVAMPSRKLKQSCPKCGHRNAVRSQYCNQCGSSLPQPEEFQSKEERQREHRDIAHPINSKFRDYLQGVVMEKYKQEEGTEIEETGEERGESQEPQQESEESQEEKESKLEQQEQSSPEQEQAPETDQVEQEEKEEEPEI